MRTEICLLGISGGLEPNSLNSALLRAAAKESPKGTVLRIQNISGIPNFLPGTFEHGLPSDVHLLIEAVRKADGVLIATPEYNGGAPGVLKNLIDWLSMDKGNGSIRETPATTVGAGGSSGARLAQLQVQALLLRLRCPVMLSPGVSVENAAQVFDAELRLVESDVNRRLRRHLEAFVLWARFHKQFTQEALGHD